MPEAACTSTQVHLQVSPDDFAGYWNAAQAIAGVQVAVGANSPFLFGKHLVAESRIPLFEQATDTRAEELKTQGVRPRVWFGERWITSIFDLFEENSRYFRALLPISTDEDPVAVLDAGGVPKLDELRLHNGTVYRWNRPVYDTHDGAPHLRVENRVLPAGPTVVDTMANAAFFAGLVRALAAQDRPVWTQMCFAAATDNFTPASGGGLEAEVYWPGVGQCPVSELVVRRLLPLAADGLRRWEVEESEITRLLGIVEQRCLTRRNGATWQMRQVASREAAGRVARRGPARDAGPLHRAHAQQRARAHLGGVVSDPSVQPRRTARRSAELDDRRRLQLAKPEGRAALRRALSEATLRGAALIVLHTASDDDLDELSGDLDAAGRAVRAPGASDRRLDPAEELIERPRTTGAAFIVIGLRRAFPGGQAAARQQRPAGPAGRVLPGAGRQGLGVLPRYTQPGSAAVVRRRWLVRVVLGPRARIRSENAQRLPARR